MTKDTDTPVVNANLVLVDFPTTAANGDMVLLMLRRKHFAEAERARRKLADALLKEVKIEFDLKLRRDDLNYGASFVYGPVGPWWWFANDGTYYTVVGRSCTHCARPMWLESYNNIGRLARFADAAILATYLAEHGVPSTHKQCPSASESNEPHE